VRKKERNEEKIKRKSPSMREKNEGTLEAERN
jgi:hypothetical protein